MNQNPMARLASPPLLHWQYPLRHPRLHEAAAIHSLVAECPPLDLNSVYSYLLLCQHHCETCVVAEAAGDIVAFTSGYILPQSPDTLFIWQIAVGCQARRQGVAQRMLHELLQRPICRRVRYLETTITPSNRASWALFSNLAEDLGVDHHHHILFAGEHFGAVEHQPEHLLRLGPFQQELHTIQH